LREAIIVTLETLAAGKITAKELLITTGERQRTDAIRIAPGFSFGQLSAGQQLPPKAYSVESLAVFLGEVNVNGRPTDSFRATFGALELIDGNGLKEDDGRPCILCSNTRFAHCADVFHRYFEINQK
jgi:hypothetical protein